MEERNPARESARWISSQAKWVQLDEAGLGSLARELEDAELVAWDERYHFRGETELTLRYLLVLDALNFCFWPGKGKWFIIGPGGEELDGYFALAYALKEAAQNSPDFYSADGLLHLDERGLAAVLGDIPLARARVRAAREVGHLLKAFGTAEAFLGRASGRCPRLLELITAHLPSFRDAALYRGREVFFYKRAQILCSDLYGIFGGEGPGSLEGLEWLTAFADYKLPQILRAKGALVFHPELAARVDRLEPIKAGSEWEIEIRAATIMAVERLVELVSRRGRQLRAFEVDWLLWNLAQEKLPYPYHRTITIFY